jgi:NADPH:quinone reductase-like Zn-dependent oxidoreductase
MKAAIVVEAGRTPVYGEFPEPQAGPGEELIQVAAAALTPLTKGRASGSHYSSAGQFPAVVGVDGVGRTAAGQRVYFVLPKPPQGAMAERVAVGRERCVALPDDVDDVTAAAIANPGMSSWAALTERAHLKAGETVLVNGATGTSGRLAVQIARHLGAARVIATGRDAATLEELRGLGADVTISLTLAPGDLEAALSAQFAAGVDVVLDYLWGASAQTAIVAAARAGKEGVPIRFVQIGSSSGADVALPGAALRSSALVLMGSGIGSVPLAGLVNAIRGVMQAAGPARLSVKTETVPLAQVEQAWHRDSGRNRVVFVIDAAGRS